MLIGSLLVFVVAIAAVAGGGFFARARATPPPTPAATPGVYLMTEGALQMEMTPLSAAAPNQTALAQLDSTVRSARIAGERYRQLGAAQADGYRTAPDLLVDTQGQHYFLPQYFQGAPVTQFDAAHPPFLVYNSAHGRQVLSGLLYYMPEEMTRQQLAGIFPPSLASWHRHVNVCVTGGTSLLDGTAVLPIHDAAVCAARGGSFTARTGWMVHIWLDQPIGKSMFAMDRPLR